MSDERESVTSAEIEAVVSELARQNRLRGELAFKRELFMRLYTRPDCSVNNCRFCWELVQRAWEDKPENC